MCFALIFTLKINETHMEFAIYFYLFCFLSIVGVFIFFQLNLFVFAFCKLMKY